MQRWFVAVDLDRCLLDTGKFQTDFVTTVLKLSTLKEETLAHEQARVEDTGGSFDVAVTVRKLLVRSGQQAQWHAITKEFSRLSRSRSYLLPGVQELIGYLETSTCPWVILTYGGDVWQRLKLSVTGLDAYPHFITDNKYKARLLDEWLTVGSAPSDLSLSDTHRYVLIDDKLLSFEGLSPPAFGMWVNAQDRSASHTDVVKVDTLAQAIAILTQRTTSRD